MSDNKNLPANQARAVEALLEGKSKAEAATAADVTTRTLLRWQDEPAFSAAVQRESRKAVSAASVKLTASLDTAVSTIIEVMDGKGGRGAGIRLRAAKIALDSAIRLNELTDILERLEALEKRI